MKKIMGAAGLIIVLLTVFLIWQPDNSNNTENIITEQQIQKNTSEVKGVSDTGLESSTEEKLAITEAESTEHIQAFEGVENSTILPDHRILTPLDNPGSSIGLSFELPDIPEPVHVVVGDEAGHLVGTFKSVISDTVHKVSLYGLTPGSIYQYRIEHGDNYSDISAFRTMGTEVANLAVFGDIQGYKQSQYDAFRSVYDMAHELIGNADMSLLAGDVVDNGDSENEWRYFYNAMDGVSEHSMILTAVGNHDVKGSVQQYLKTFNYPDNGIEGLEGRNFYVDIPYGRIAVFDTESTSRYDEQAVWLEDIFSNDSIGFKLVLMHRSAYPMAYDEAHVRKLAEAFEAVGVDLVISGHDHIYNRTTVSNGQKVQVGEGVTYLVTGSGSGSKYYEADSGSHRFWKDYVYDEDHPVFCHIQVDEEVLAVRSYAVVDGAEVQIDAFDMSLHEIE